MTHAPTILRITRRVRTWWWIKGLGTTGFMWGFFALYFQLLENPRVAPLQMPLLGWDGAVPFHPMAWVFYLSLWVYTSLPVALQPSFVDLLYYGLAISLVCAFGLGFFYWWPTMIPASYALPQDHGWNLLAGVDAPGNAFPSLHVATSVFSAAWLDAQIRAMRLATGWRWGNLIWCAAIVLSTLSTRQHVLLDMLGGVLLGGAMAWLTLLVRARRRSVQRSVTA